MLNNVNLQGRFVETPELKTTPSGAKVTSFQLVAQRNHKSQDEECDTACINCVAYQKTAEFICSNFTKGSNVMIGGELSSRSYTDNEGKKSNITEVVVKGAYLDDGSEYPF